MQVLDISPHLKLKNILFATDLSHAASKALSYAAEIARQYGATVYAVHVLHPQVYPFQLPETWPQMAEAEEQIRENARQEMEKALQGISHELIFREGPIWRTLARIMNKNDIDLLVIGTHGRMGMEKAVMGSVAEEIFRQATCPVLTVGPCVSVQQGFPKLNRILYATDFSPESLAAAPYAVSFARENHAQLILLHCTRRTQEAPAMFDRLREVLPLGAELSYPPICIVRHGLPSEEILAVSEGRRADLILLGVRSAGWRLAATIHLAESTAYKIVTRATCPVLTVRG